MLLPTQILQSWHVKSTAPPQHHLRHPVTRPDPPVDPDEIRRLGKRFRKLDLDNSGSLSVDEFMSLPELQQNPLVQRVIEIFDEDGNGEVDFKGQPRLLDMPSSGSFC